jgi:hypothetical protein
MALSIRPSGLKLKGRDIGLELREGMALSSCRSKRPEAISHSLIALPMMLVEASNLPSGLKLISV